MRGVRPFRIWPLPVPCLSFSGCSALYCSPQLLFCSPPTRPALCSGKLLHRLEGQRLSSKRRVPPSVQRPASQLSPSLPPHCPPHGHVRLEGLVLPCRTPVLRERLPQTRNFLGCEGHGPHTWRRRALACRVSPPPPRDGPCHTLTVGGCCPLPHLLPDLGPEGRRSRSWKRLPASAAIPHGSTRWRPAEASGVFWVGGRPEALLDAVTPDQ